MFNYTRITFGNELTVNTTKTLMEDGRGNQTPT